MVKEFPLSELTEMEAVLKNGCGKDVVSMQDYLLKLATYKARVNELLSQWQDARLNKTEKFMQTFDQYIPTMKQYEYRDRLNIYCKEENAMIYRLERINSTIEQQTEALRSILSFIKEEIKNV